MSELFNVEHKLGEFDKLGEVSLGMLKLDDMS